MSYNFFCRMSSHGGAYDAVYYAWGCIPAEGITRCNELTGVAKLLGVECIRDFPRWETYFCSVSVYALQADEAPPTDAETAVLNGMIQAVNNSSYDVLCIDDALYAQLPQRDVGRGLDYPHLVVYSRGSVFLYAYEGAGTHYESQDCLELNGPLNYNGRIIGTTTPATL